MRLIGLIKGKKLVWEYLDVSTLDDFKPKYRWYNKETKELLTTYKFNRLVNFEEFDCLWSKI